ncbi:MAG: alpha/beta hydrolase, partial [Actinomycetes bacterium]
DGTAAARAAAGLPQPRTSILAHSYGTVVVDEAADVPGPLAADSVVLLGSPGMEPSGAHALEAPEVYDAWSANDPVSYGGWHGSAPSLGWYGSTGLPDSHRMTHSDYYDPDFPTVNAIGAVVVGARAAE